MPTKTVNPEKLEWNWAENEIREMSGWRVRTIGQTATVLSVHFVYLGVEARSLVCVCENKTTAPQSVAWRLAAAAATACLTLRANVCHIKTLTIHMGNMTITRLRL